MNTINWESAPEGYPLWLEYLEKAIEDDDERRKEKGVWVKEQSDRFVTVKDAFWSKPEEGYYRIHRRPSSPAWSGPQDGLPPVGTICKYKRVSEWVKVEVFAVKPNYNGSHTALCTFENGTWVGCADPSHFMPIRTPEQIAQEQREAAINAALMAINKVGHQAGYTYSVVEALYEAGLLKLEQPK